MDKPGKLESLDPSVKELLATCAKYNLDQGISGAEEGISAEILEQIQSSEELASNKSAPNSPLKQPQSPSPLPRPPTDSQQVINGNFNGQKQPMIVTVSSAENPTSPVTSLLNPSGQAKSPPPYSSSKGRQLSRDASPASSSANDGGSSSVIKVGLNAV